jgi:hypothetical protein
MTAFPRTVFYSKQHTHVPLSSSSKVCPLYSGLPSPRTKFRHLSLSLVSSSVSPWFVMLRLTSFIHISLGLPLLRVPSGSHSKIFRGSLCSAFILIIFALYRVSLNERRTEHILKPFFHFLKEATVLISYDLLCR